MVEYNKLNDTKLSVSDYLDKFNVR
jgi:hypothetical protein